MVNAKNSDCEEIMLSLGISGGVYGKQQFAPAESHDSAAVLLEYDRPITAVEEERLVRIKHTNRIPVEAVRFCLKQQGMDLSDLDLLAICMDEQRADTVVGDYGAGGTRQLVHSLLAQEFGTRLPDSKLVFVPHHVAHALSTFVPSGFDSALVITLDGSGDGLSGMVLSGRQNGVKVLRSFNESKSLGNYYSAIVHFLGFGHFDEYKVMGLAPYGDPSRFRDIFRSFYELVDNGKFDLRWDHIRNIEPLLGAPRTHGSELSAVHWDIAAALQESLELIVFHVLRYFRSTTGLRKLCLAGGVAQNSSMNGKILAEGLFDSIFVQPASYDAGCAWGAALQAFYTHGGARTSTTLNHVYLGRDIGSTEAISVELHRWRPLIEFERCEDIATSAASLLASGKVLGWVEGRSEFGPRALGNRSILADPRLAENKNIVNAMVKKREAFRPFAPAVLAEDFAEFFEPPPITADLSFMTFVVKVRPGMREMLGAVTHVDGTARVQTVSDAVNPRFAALLRAFKKITGVGVLLNTSFNNNAEPIVDSVADAVGCFLTTGLHGLVVGDVLAKKDRMEPQHILRLAPSLPRFGFPSGTARPKVGRLIDSLQGEANYARIQLADQLIYLLSNSDGDKSVCELMRELDLDCDATNIIEQLWLAWSHRLILMTPPPHTAEFKTIREPSLDTTARG
jgi:carbamoyltransferase